MTIGKKIRKYRKEKGLTQKELAQRTGLNVVTISSYETGRYKNPSLETINKIASALNIDVANLFDDEIDELNMIFEDLRDPKSSYIQKNEEEMKSCEHCDECSEALRQIADNVEKLRCDLMNVLEKIDAYKA